MLLGEAAPDAGEVSLGANVRMAYLPQNIIFKDEELTVLDYFREDLSVLEGKAREHLAKFMFFGANVYKKIRLLSGGERVRLMLGKLLFNDINLLILDEPTNHLDTASIESVEEALLRFKGTIFFISHDRYFINKISDRIIEIEGNTFKSYSGNYDYYKSEKEKQAAGRLKDMAMPVEKDSLKSAGSSLRQEKYSQKTDKDSQRSDNSSLRADIGNLESGKRGKTVNTSSNKNEKIKSAGNLTPDSTKIEDRIKSVESSIKEIEVCMEAAGSDYEKLNKLYSEKEKLSSELDLLLEKWIIS
jgi:ATPase subunit of ABC transporter with duplicated ATPase domains